MAQVATFWMGSMDALERACLASFARRGHEVVLYSYGEHAPSPFYEVRSASEIFDRSFIDEFVTDGRPNIAHFADAFRIKMFTTTPFIWIDCDLLLRADLTIAGDDDIFVREGQRDIIASLLRISDQRIAQRALAEVLKQAGRDLPWAAPQKAIATALRAEGYAGPVRDAKLYNPIPVDDFHMLLLPEFRDRCEQICEQAQTVHVYNNILQKIGFYKGLLPPDGSYLHHLLTPYATEAGFIGTYPASVVRQMVEGWRLRFSGKNLGLGAVLRQIGPAVRTTVRRRMWT